MPREPKDQPLTGMALVEETCCRIRVARNYWDAPTFLGQSKGQTGQVADVTA